MIICRAGVDLPAPVSISVEDQIIWSKNTGRAANAEMIGDIIAEKKSVKIKWAFLQESELVTIKNYLVAGFFPFTFHDKGTDITITSYRGTLSKEQLGQLGDGIFWYRSASVDIIQK